MLSLRIVAVSELASSARRAQDPAVRSRTGEGCGVGRVATSLSDCSLESGSEIAVTAAGRTCPYDMLKTLPVIMLE